MFLFLFCFVIVYALALDLAVVLIFQGVGSKSGDPDLNQGCIIRYEDT